MDDKIIIEQLHNILSALHSSDENNFAQMKLLHRRIDLIEDHLMETMPDSEAMVVIADMRRKSKDNIARQESMHEQHQAGLKLLRDILDPLKE